MWRRKMSKDKKEREEDEWYWRKKEKDFLEAEERVNTGLYKLLRSFSADLEHPDN
jgi:hypothetical protein